MSQNQMSQLFNLRLAIKMKFSIDMLKIDLMELETQEPCLPRTLLIKRKKGDIALQEYYLSDFLKTYSIVLDATKEERNDSRDGSDAE